MVTTIKLKLKKIFLKVTGKVNYLKKGIKCNHKWYGNTYGGFYVCPQLLTEKSIVYSFGIGEDISFDNAIMAQHQCKVYGFDPTPKSINWVKKQNKQPNFNFYEYGIGAQSGFVDFYLPKNPDHVSGSMITQKNVDVLQKVTVEMKSVTDIMLSLNHKHIDVLKMDIEGAEYDVIDSILNANLSISQILIEFHERFVEDGKNKTIATIQKLKSKGYEIFAVSDTFEEISFIREA